MADLKRGPFKDMLVKFMPWKFPLAGTFYEKRGSMLPRVTEDKIGPMMTKDGNSYYATQKYKYALPPAPREMIELWGKKQHVNLISTEQNVFRYFRYDFNPAKAQVLYTDEFTSGHLPTDENGKVKPLETHAEEVDPIEMQRDGKFKEVKVMRSVFSPNERRFEIDMIKHNQSYDARKPKEPSKWYQSTPALFIGIAFAVFLMYYAYGAYLAPQNVELATRPATLAYEALKSMEASLNTRNALDAQWLNWSLQSACPTPYIPTTGPPL